MYNNTFAIGSSNFSFAPSITNTSEHTDAGHDAHSISKHTVEVIRHPRQVLMKKIAKLGNGIHSLAKMGMEGTQLCPYYYLEAVTKTHLPPFDTEVQKAVDEWQKSNTTNDFDTWVKNNRSTVWMTSRCFHGVKTAEFGQVRYCSTEVDRAAFRLSVENGQLMKNGTPASFRASTFEVKEMPIFVLGYDNELYVDYPREGKVHHSGFMAGGVVLAAGHIQIQSGRITFLSDQSGHYKPTIDQTINVLRLLEEKGLDISQTKILCLAIGGFEFCDSLLLTQFLSKITTLEYGNSVQLLNTLEFLEKHDVNISKIQVKQADGKHVPANEYIKNLTQIHNTNPPDNAKRAIDYLKSKEKNISDIKTIITTAYTPTIALMKHMGSTPDVVVY